MELSNDESHLMKWIDDHKDEATQLLKDLIRIPSPTGEEGPGQEFVTKYLSDMGLEIETLVGDMDALKDHPEFIPVDPEINVGNYEERPNIIGTYKGAGGGKSLLLFAHIDTVPPGDGWDYDPYGAEIDGGPWVALQVDGRRIVVKDVIADAFLQQILTRPAEYAVIATLNLNGDYISDALAACVGGIGIAPGGNINYQSGHAIFEATHGTAPKYAGQDKVNPGSVILSGEMMFRHLGWNKAADLIVDGLERTIGSKVVTYDFARLMEGATEVRCSEFGAAIVGNMG